MKVRALLTVAFIGQIILITASHAAYFEKLSVTQTAHTTTLTLRAYIPTGYLHPQLINCLTTGSSLTCDMKAHKPEASLMQISSPVPHILSVTLPYRTDIWQVNIKYRGKIYKAGS